MLLAALAGIRVFATGGIGGVHRSFSQQTGISPDVSADLPQLASTQMIVVCAGAKAILDIPATLEFLETWGVLVIGYRSDYFPAFYSHSSGLKTPIRANSVEEIVQVARAHWGLGRQTAILVANPLPAEDSLGYEEVETAIQQALQEAEQNGMLGPAVTPFLLQRVSEITDGESLMTNLALLLNNARLAAEIAVAWATPTG
jgi:pseudouridine-5'-phosphate glycosidase